MMSGSNIFNTLSVVLLTATAAGADWPEFCGSHCKNMVSAEKGLPESFVPGEKDSAQGQIILSTARNVKWGTRISSITYSAPSVAAGRIFIGGGETGLGVFKCLDAASGKLLWQYAAPYRDFPAEVEPGLKFMLGHITPNLGICATAAVDGPRVYFVNHRCEVLCLDAAGSSQPLAPPPVASPAPAKPRKGFSPPPPAPPGVRRERIVWSFDMWNYGIRPSDGCNGSPLIDGDLLYVNTSNGVDRDAELDNYDDRRAPAPAAPSLIALDKRSGRLLASDDARHIGPNLMHGQWSTPSLGTVNGRKLLFFGGGDGVCYAFAALDHVPQQPVKLQTVWSFDCNPPEYRQFGSLSWAAHYSLGDKRLKKSLNKQNLSSFVGMSEIIGCPVLYKNRIYVAIGRDPEHGKGRGALWCIDATQTGDITGQGKIWGYQGLDRTLSTPAISDGLLYIADVAGRLHCLDAETGRVYWVHDTDEKLWSSALAADGKLYLPTTKHLWVLAASREKRVLSQINLGGPCYASPVAADGVLYVNSRHYLWAVQRQP